MKLYQNKLDFKVNSVPHSFFKCSAEEIRVSEKSTVQDAIKNSITWFETSLKSFQKLQLVHISLQAVDTVRLSRRIENLQ